MTRDLYLGSEVLRLRVEVVPGFVRVTCENLTAIPAEVSVAAAGAGLRVLSSLLPLSLPGWGEQALLMAYETPRPTLLEVVAITCDGLDALLARASLLVPVAASNCLASWGSWARARAWLPPATLAQPARGEDVARVLGVLGEVIAVENVPPEYDLAWASLAIPALVAVGPARADLFTANPDLARRCEDMADGETSSRRRALVQVGIAIAKVIDLVDINWELADILTTLGEIGRLLPQAGVPASAVTPLMQLLARTTGRKVEDLDKSSQAALARGIGRLERLATGGGPAETREAGCK